MDLARLHGVLRDKTRVSILKLVGERGTVSYTDPQRSLGIEHTGKLNYHLKVLGDLLEKDEVSGYYSLSAKGRAAVNLLESFATSPPNRSFGLLVFGALLTGLGLLTLFPAISDTMMWIGQAGNLVMTFAFSVSAISVPVGAFLVVSGIGACYSRRWAWSLALSSLLARLLLSLAEIGFVGSFALQSPLNTAERTTFIIDLAYVSAPLVIPMAAGVFYLSRRQVRAYFGRGTETHAKPMAPTG